MHEVIEFYDPVILFFIKCFDSKEFYKTHRAEFLQCTSIL